MTFQIIWKHANLFFCEKTDHPPVTLTYLRNSRGQAHQCSRGHKNFGSKLCWTKCAPISKKKDVCGVENWRIIYYFQSLKNCPMTCTPYLQTKNQGGRGNRRERYTSWILDFIQLLLLFTQNEREKWDSSTRGESKWVVKPLSKISHGCSIITLQRVIFKG